MKNLTKCIFCVFVCLVICVSLCSCSVISVNAHIFSDISECGYFEDNLSENSEIVLYDNPDKDNNLKDLQYNDFYGAQYKSKKLKFKIFAYEFVDEETAKEYFENSAGRTCAGEKDFYISSNIFNHTIRVVDNNRAYVLFTKTIYEDAVNELLSEAFSVEFSSDVLVEQLKNSITEQ